MTFFRAAILSLGLTTAAASSAGAFDLSVTTLDGSMIATYAIDDLRALGETRIVTNTSWTNELTAFTGVSAADLLDDVGADVDVVTAVALDYYIIEIPVSVLRDDKALIAYEMNDAPMSVADKGPLWIMFDFDAAPLDRHPDLRNYAVWQLVELQLD